MVDLNVCAVSLSVVGVPVCSLSSARLSRGHKGLKEMCRFSLSLEPSSPDLYLPMPSHVHKMKETIFRNLTHLHWTPLQLICEEYKLSSITIDKVALDLPKKFCISSFYNLRFWFKG